MVCRTVVAMFSDNWYNQSIPQITKRQKETKETKETHIYSHNSFAFILQGVVHHSAKTVRNVRLAIDVSAKQVSMVSDVN